jgi:uncharacterized protein
MIDFFDCKFWIKETFSEYNKLKKLFSENNIKNAVVSNHLSLSYDWNIGNNYLTSNSSLVSDKSIYFCFLIAPEVCILKDLNKYFLECYDKKVRMFRFFPKSHIFKLNDYYMQKIFKILDNYRFPIMIDLKQLDITGNKYFDVCDIENILHKYSRMPFILECSLKMLMFNRLIFPLMEKYKNLYIETSNLLLVNQIEDLVKKFGSNRLIFGTNYPVLEVEFSVGRILLSDLKESEKRDICSANIKTILDDIEID